MKGSRAFTLIEIMLVVGIIALVATIGIPAIYHAFHPESLQAAVNDVVDACAKARARAIWSSQTWELRWSPLKGEYQVVAMAQDAAPGEDPTTAPAPGPVPSTVADASASPDAKPGSGISGHISDHIGIEMLDVNFRECKDDDIAHVRFYPNGTCDEMTLILHSLDTGESRKISLELVTALAEVAPFP